MISQGQTGVVGPRGEAGTPGRPVSILFDSLGILYKQKDASNPTTQIISGSSWTKRTTGAERIQRCSSKEEKCSEILGWFSIYAVKPQRFDCSRAWKANQEPLELLEPKGLQWVESFLWVFVQSRLFWGLFSDFLFQGSGRSSWPSRGFGYRRTWRSTWSRRTPWPRWQ